MSSFHNTLLKNNWSTDPICWALLQKIVNKPDGCYSYICTGKLPSPLSKIVTGFKYWCIFGFHISDWLKIIQRRRSFLKSFFSRIFPFLTLNQTLHCHNQAQEQGLSKKSHLNINFFRNVFALGSGKWQKGQSIFFTCRFFIYNIL